MQIMENIIVIVNVLRQTTSRNTNFAISRKDNEAKFTY